MILLVILGLKFNGWHCEWKTAQCRVCGCCGPLRPPNKAEEHRLEGGVSVYIIGSAILHRCFTSNKVLEGSRTAVWGGGQSPPPTAGKVHSSSKDSMETSIEKYSPH